MHRSSAAWWKRGLAARYRHVFRTTYGQGAECRRAEQIAVRPWKIWRGRLVYAVTCRGDFGKGPHVLWLEEHWLWTFLDPATCICPFHS